MKKLAAAVASLAVVALAPNALAATYHPNKLGDHSPNGCSHSDCTLREAITKANHHSGPDKVVLKGGQTYNLNIPNALGDEDANATGDLDVLGALTITSSNHKLATVDAQAIDGVFEIGPSSALNATFDRIKVRGAKDVSDAGGGIRARNGGTLTLLHSSVVGNKALADDGGGVSVGTLSGTGSLKVVKSVIAGNRTVDYAGGIEADNGPEHISISRSRIANNHAGGGYGGIVSESGSSTLHITRSKINGNVAASSDGGGILSTDTLVIRKSTISGNHAVGNGGGIYNTGSLNVQQSTISGNSSGGGGGGVRSENGTLRLTNDTIARNTAPDDGGGLYYAGSTGDSAHLNAVTIAYNSSDDGAGTFVYFASPAGSFHIANSIVAKNTAPSLPDCSDGLGVVASNGHNLYGVGLACQPSGGDRHDVSAKLGKLRSNGGPTKTIALLKHSPAINHAASSAPPRDQRGHKRHDPDIGAFER